MSDVTNELIPMETLTILNQPFEIVDARARNTKMDLPTNDDGTINAGDNGNVLISNGDGTYKWGVPQTDVTAEVVETALGYVPADQNELNILAPMYHMNGCIVSNGGEIILNVGEEVEIGQEITFRYKRKDGCQYLPTIANLPTNSFITPNIIAPTASSPTEYGEHSLTIEENWTSVKITGAYFVAVKLIKKDASDIAYDDANAKLGVNNIQSAIDTLTDRLNTIGELVTRDVASTTLESSETRVMENFNLNTGSYMCVASFQFSDSSADATGSRVIDIRKNGVSINNVSVKPYELGTKSQCSSLFIVENNGTSIEVCAYQSSGNALSVTGTVSLMRIA